MQNNPLLHFLGGSGTNKAYCKSTKIERAGKGPNYHWKMIKKLAIRGLALQLVFTSLTE